MTYDKSLVDDGTSCDKYQASFERSMGKINGKHIPYEALARNSNSVVNTLRIRAGLDPLNGSAHREPVTVTLERSMSSWTRGARIPTAFVVWLLVGGCVNRTWHTPEEVRRAIDDRSMLGATAERAVAVLTHVRLQNGDSITVGSFDVRRGRLEASVPHARRTWFTRWDIDISVTFDSTKRVQRVDVVYGAVNPM